MKTKNITIVDKYGKESALQYLLGGVMREMKGKADPVIVLALIKEFLKK